MSTGLKIKIFICFLIVYALTMGGHIYSPDGELMFRTTQSLVENHSLAVYPLFGFGTRTGKDGLEYAQYGVGQPVAAIPFYLLGKAGLSLTDGKFLVPIFRDTVTYHTGTGKEYVLRFFVSMFNQLVMALTVVLIATFAWWLGGDRSAAVMTAVLYGGATMALPHSRTFFSEPLAGLMVLVSFFYLFKGLSFRRKLYVVIAGVAFGYAMLTRADSLLFLPGLILFIALENIRFFGKKIKGIGLVLAQFRKESLWQWILFGLPIVLFVAIILGLNYYRYGDVFATGYEDQAEGIKFSTPLLAGLYGFLFSVGKGMFFFSPPLILVFFAVKRFWEEWRNVALALFVMVGVFVLVQSTWQNWAGGWCWGPRHIFQIHALLTVPIVMLLLPPRSSVLRIIYGVILVIGIAVQLYGSSQSFIDFYMDFYRTPAQPPNAHLLYSDEEVGLLSHYYRLEFATPEESNPATTLDFRMLIAPINDSVYIMQNSQWYGYLTMWRNGRTDFFWLRYLKQLYS